MKLGMVGLGKMGLNMAQRLAKNNHEVICFDALPQAQQKASALKLNVADSLEKLCLMQNGKKVIWLMVPSGDIVDEISEKLIPHLKPHDIVIDGGNSHFIDSVRRYKNFKQKGISFVDVGVSGGVFGLDRGYCLMAGGDKESFDFLKPIFSSLSPNKNAVSPTQSRTKDFSDAQEGFLYCGKSGSGHYVKMIHNAIEYGMMQAFAEGFELLKNANNENLEKDLAYDFDLREIGEVWRRGSVVSSWLLDLLADSLYKDPQYNEFSGHVPDSGEARWALMEAIKQSTPTPVLSDSLFARFRSRQKESFGGKVLSALRKEFGGHKE